MICLMRLLKQKPRGFTLVELLVVVAITGAIAGVIAQTIMMMLDVVTENRSHVAAIMQVQNAERWMERDVKMAQTIDVNRNDIYTTGTLVMTWSDWSGTHTEVIYYLEADELRRTEKIFSADAYDAIRQEWTVPDVIYHTYIARDVVAGSPQTAFHQFDMTSPNVDRHIVRFDMTVKNEESTGGSSTEVRSFSIKPRSIW